MDTQEIIEILKNEYRIEDAEKFYEENHYGTYKYLNAYAESVVEEHGIDEWIAGYVDYDAITRDLLMAGDVFVIENGQEYEFFRNV